MLRRLRFPAQQSVTPASQESDSEFTLCRKLKKLGETATNQGSAAAVSAPQMTLVAVCPCRTGGDPGYVTELDQSRRAVDFFDS